MESLLQFWEDRSLYISEAHITEHAAWGLVSPGAPQPFPQLSSTWLGFFHCHNSLFLTPFIPKLQFSPHAKDL